MPDDIVHEPNLGRAKAPLWVTIDGREWLAERHFFKEALRTPPGGAVLVWVCPRCGFSGLNPGPKIL